MKIEMKLLMSSGLRVLLHQHRSSTHVVALPSIITKPHSGRQLTPGSCNDVADVNVQQCRLFGYSPPRQATMSNRMSAWQLYSYKDELTLSKTMRIPSIGDPGDVLVRVHASSVNPIDVMMKEGYGEKLINLIRWQLGVKHFAGSEFPLTLGRDFSGVITAVGRGVTGFKVGDEVWGATGGFREGCHADYCLASVKEIGHKPKNLSHIEAASIPYVALTTWSALCSVGEIRKKNAPGQRVFIQGGSGGVGTFAIQLMKAWGAHVTSSCSTDAVPLVQSLGADVVIDYKTQDIKSELKDSEGFDIFLDTMGADNCMDLLKTWSNAKYVTIKTPFLKDIDEHGFPAGAALSVSKLGCGLLQGLKDGRSYRWAFFIPDPHALNIVKELVEVGKIKPVVEKVVSFEDAPLAYDHVGQSHSRGKTVLNMNSIDKSEN